MFRATSKSGIYLVYSRRKCDEPHQLQFPVNGCLAIELLRESCLEKPLRIKAATLTTHTFFTVPSIFYFILSSIACLVYILVFIRSHFHYPHSYGQSDLLKEASASATVVTQHEPPGAPVSTATSVEPTAPGVPQGQGASRCAIWDDRRSSKSAS